MFGLTAFNPFAASLARSSYDLARQDQASLVMISSELGRMYDGNQMGYLLNWLAGHIKDTRIRRRYAELAVFYNIVRLVTDRVTTVGVSPVRVVWCDEEGQPHVEAQRLWDEILEDWLGDDGWDPFVLALCRRTQVMKTMVGEVEWDDHNDILQLNYFGPHEMDVDYAPGNLNKHAPDRYTFLREDATGLFESWDFSNHDKGESGLRLDENGKTIAALPVLDPRTDRSVVPFVPFRTVRCPDFFAHDGQEEIKIAQEFVNRVYTRISVLVEMGVNKTLILSGSGWADADGNMAAMPLDIGLLWKEPEDFLEAPRQLPKIRWDGPDVVAEIDAALKVASHWVAVTAAAQRINQSAITTKGEGMSGYALNIDTAALRNKHKEDATRLRKPLTRMARLISLYWNHYGPTGKTFPANVRPHVVIPDWTGGSTTTDEVNADILLVNNRLKRRMPLIYKYEPGIPPGEAAALVAEVPPVAAPKPNLAPGRSIVPSPVPPTSHPAPTEGAGGSPPAAPRVSEKPAAPAEGTP